MDEYVVCILLAAMTMGLGIRCTEPIHTIVLPLNFAEADDRTPYPPQTRCKNRRALLLWKANPVMDWSVTKVTKMPEPYPEGLPLEKNICSVYTYVTGCRMIRFVVTDFKSTYFTTQHFAARYINGRLLNISVTDRTFVLVDENYQIYATHVDKVLYAKADGTLEYETNIPPSLLGFDGDPVLITRVAENQDKWAIFQLCDHDVAWVAVSTEKAKANPEAFLQHYRAEIERTLHELNIDTSAMVDIDEILLPFEPAGLLRPYRIRPANRSVAEAPKKTKGAGGGECLRSMKRLLKDRVCNLDSKCNPNPKIRKVVRSSVNRIMDRVHCKNAASSSGWSSASSSRRLNRNDSFSDSDTSVKPKRRGRRYRARRVPRHSTDLSDEETFNFPRERMDDYWFYVDISIFVGSWNVNGQPPVPMHDWLTSGIRPPDIYAIGFQELDRSKEALLFHNSPREEEWLKAVARDLHPAAQYRKVALVRLAGMMLIVFVRKPFVSHVKGVDVDTAGTGILGKLGNKGGVAARFELLDTSVCFVNVHLAAHVEGNDKRNQNYRDILSRISFRKVVPPRTIEDHDQVYWFGDLNYRITELRASTIKKMIAEKQYDALIKCDQLQRNQTVGGAFDKYEEGRLMFQPTYKYDIGTSNWDSSKKCRTPSWCDRILWKGKDIEQLKYRSHLSLTISDHKPISAVFATKFRVVDRLKYQYFQEEVTKQLDRWDAKSAQPITVSPKKVNFDDVFFMERQAKILTIVNRGQVNVQFEFVKKPEESRYCKDWLRIETYAGSIMPGEKCDVNLRIYVDKTTAHQLNSGEDKIEDVLFLHFDVGTDIRIKITGTYKRSCFGASLDFLSALGARPINVIPKEELINMEQVHSHARIRDQSEAHIVPPAITRLVEHLREHGMEEQRLFQQPGIYWEILHIRDWLDNGLIEVMPEVNIHSVAEALLLLLDSTPEPLIPYELHESCLSVTEVGHKCSQCKEIIASLSALNKQVFLYLCHFLRELLTMREENGLNLDTTITLFGEVFLRDPPPTRTETSSEPPGTTADENSTHQRKLDRKRSNFMYHILINLETLLD